MRLKRILSAIILLSIIVLPLYTDKIIVYYNSFTAIDHQKAINNYYHDSNISLNDKFHIAVSEDDIVKMRIFIDQGADISVPDNMGGNALHVASMKGHLDIVEYLTEKGAGVNIRDSFNRTPLMLAAQYGKFKVVRHLIDKGAAINAKDVYGHTALSSALETGEREIAAYLAKRGALGINNK
ncbi:MAG: hypothetical protein CVV44_11115 [Spirochaetae bacterium HGW-Spirochaetae-1]|jgi:ankyrin repeat protein|nr:MAG: hypothetical protein CVV44_11115 [Spirochaetae bacterium HGW-Spirochaetae-1]